MVYLGDYIDRGTDSRAVIDLMLDEPLPDFDRIHLKGNHDNCLARFLVDPEIGELWLSHGGDDTLRSYGVVPPRSFRISGRFSAPSRTCARCCRYGMWPSFTS